MTEQEKYQVYLQVSHAVEKDPEVVEWVIKGVTDGFRISAKQAREDQLGWEIVANMAMNKRLLDGNEMFIADKVERLAPRAACRWDWYIEKLRKIVARKKGDGL